MAAALKHTMGGVRIVSGSFADDGTIRNGKGFTVTPSGATTTRQYSVRIHGPKPVAQKITNTLGMTHGAAVNKAIAPIVPNALTPTGTNESDGIVVLQAVNAAGIVAPIDAASFIDFAFFVSEVTEVE